MYVLSLREYSAGLEEETKQTLLTCESCKRGIYATFERIKKPMISNLFITCLLPINSSVVRISVPLILVLSSTWVPLFPKQNYQRQKIIIFSLLFIKELRFRKDYAKVYTFYQSDFLNTHKYILLTELSPTKFKIF